MFEEPQRHRDTEEAQSQDCPQITQIHPPTQKPRRHEDTKESQSPPTHPIETADHADKRKYHPPTLQRGGAEAQRRREDLTQLFRVARFRPSDGRKPLGRDTAPNTSVHLGVPAQRLALEKRKPRHLSSSFNSWERFVPRQNRRAPGTSAGEKAGCDERSRSEQTGFSPTTGDHQIACRSTVKRRHRVSRSTTAPLRLCVFAGRADGWA